MDWRVFGYETALEAKPASNIDKHVKACKRYDVVVDVSHFSQGYHEGAREFCTPKYVYLHVRKTGKPEHVNVCPEESIQLLEPAYELAMEYFLAHEVLSDTKYQYSQLSDEEYTLSQKINAKPTSSELNDSDVKEALARLDEAQKNNLKAERWDVSSKKQVVESKMDRTKDLIQLLEKRHFVLLGIK